MATNTAPANGAAAAPTEKPSPSAPRPTAPLAAVVSDAVRRWYGDALREAQRGDVVRRRREGR